ncbi:MAG: LytR C-terminal domain-containing protein [Candidatus Coatesbacteria bacterium]|nr:MAG: LytR C-terminal domain-containing protein [Candidatus Coatesbacteria bacterium]
MPTNKRVTSGRLAKVEERKRAKRIRVIAGVISVVIVVVLIVVAVQHRNAIFKRGGNGAETAETLPTEEPPAETPTEETPTSPDTAELNVYVINNTSVPQRFGNALTAIENYNVKSEGIFTIETERPEIPYAGGTIVLYRPGYKEYAGKIADALGGSINVTQADITMVCGQDISELILEAFVKEGRLTEEVRVEVLNGCGLEGAAGKTKERLESNGYTVIAVGNATTFDYEETVLFAAGGEEGKAKRIADLFGMDKKNIRETDYDIKVIVSDDYST